MKIFGVFVVCDALHALIVLLLLLYLSTGHWRTKHVLVSNFPCVSSCPDGLQRDIGCDWNCKLIFSLVWYLKWRLTSLAVRGRLDCWILLKPFSTQTSQKALYENMN